MASYGAHSQPNRRVDRSDHRLDGPHLLENTQNKYLINRTTRLAFRPEPRDEWSCQGEPMTNYPYILFNKSPEQLRRLGARGGKRMPKRNRPPSRRSGCVRRVPVSRQKRRTAPVGPPVDPTTRQLSCRTSPAVRLKENGRSRICRSRCRSHPRSAKTARARISFCGSPVPNLSANGQLGVARMRFSP